MANTHTLNLKQAEESYVRFQLLSDQSTFMLYFLDLTAKMSQDLEFEVEKLEGGAPFGRRVTAIVIGCGMRGQMYASYALKLPNRLKIVGLADPVAHRVQKVCL